MNPGAIMVATTPHLEGWKINEHIGVVSAHAVAGTGVFSDFKASFTDFFGGRSGTYERHLAGVTERAIENLRRYVRNLGGNCVIGLQIHHSEISGKKMQMLMVSVTGTAVRACRLGGTSLAARESTPVVSGDAVEIEFRRRRKVAWLESDDVNYGDLDAGMWEFLTSQRVAEAAPQVWKIVQRIPTDLREKELEARFQNTVRYFANLPRDLCIAALYDGIWNHSMFERVVQDLHLADLHRITEFLQSEDEARKRQGLRLVRAEKDVYESGDIALLEKIRALVLRSFPENVEIVERKRGLRGRPTKKWKCNCGEENDMEIEYCGLCRGDKQGFSQDEFTAGMALEVLDERMAILKSLFQGRSAQGDGASDAI